MRILYNFGIYLYVFGIRIASLWNPKARLWFSGRRTLKRELNEIKNNNSLSGCFWFHCASLGEFEQARPVIEALKENTNNKICVTFFSPSGYEVRKNYPVDKVMYLPLDTPGNARHFVKSINPAAAVFVKYELWMNHLKALKAYDIPVMLLSATFRKKHRYFKWYGGYFRKMLRQLDMIFVQNERSSVLLQRIGVDSIVAGDTRFDRVWDLAKDRSEDQIGSDFSENGFTIIAGSSWQVEEKILLEFIRNNPTIKIILAPHNIQTSHLKEIESIYGDSIIRYSQYQKGSDNQVLLVDNIGKLSNLYQYADLAFVGGGFTGKLHNILEPAAYGIPVCFGPKHANFQEAETMIEFGSGFDIRSSEELEELVEKVKTKTIPNNAEFIQQHTGATARFVEYFNKLKL